MRRAVLGAVHLVVALAAIAAQPTYPREIARWLEVLVPPKSDRATRKVWDLAANYSMDEWRVFSRGGRTCARLWNEKIEDGKERPKFTPAVGDFQGASSFAAVDDGWLVGFNRGEFGTALYWFSRDGTRNYKVSNHQVVDFFLLSDGVYAIEGLAYVHTGSIIHIEKPPSGSGWRATTVAQLPFAPYAISITRDGTMLITLSQSLVSVGSDRKVRTLLADAPWDGLYPNSSVLSRDERKLHIGMRQFVGEFDFTSKTLRLLVPSKEFLNKLTKEEEQRVRRFYGR